MIKSTLLQRMGIHFMAYCNRQTPSSNDYSIARTVLRHTDHVLDLTQEQLSQEACMSAASISRFFHKCGFANFQEFKKQFQMFLTQRNLRRTHQTMAITYGKSDAEIVCGGGTTQASGT